MRNFFIVIAVCSVLIVVSCRDESDDLISYAYEDVMNFAEANSSLEGQFKAIWTAMNCNYPIWDYEEQQGLNWDEIYDKYLPQFKKLDEEYNAHNPIPDSIVSELYDEIITPLHDGHFIMYLKNVYTGKKISKHFTPQAKRVVESISYDYSSFAELFYLSTFFKPSLKYYESTNELLEVEKEDDYIFAHFNDGVVYFRIPQFNLTQIFSQRNVDDKSMRIYGLWKSWFNCIQRLQTNNTLKGVVIDLRNNPGGLASDFQYVLGALINGNNDKGKSHFIGYFREKTGIGRYDYSCLYKCSFPIFDKEHVVVDVPIVVLVNNLTGSMAEMVCLSAKQLINGYTIGTRTFGAYSPSVSDNSYAFTYAGNVGDPSLATDEERLSYFAPFYIDIPTYAFLSLDKQVIDGMGVEPDDEVHLDWKKHSEFGVDYQIDRALEYIRTGK